VVLSEVGRSHWEEGLAWTADRFPYQLAAMRDDNFGTSGYSRIPGTMIVILSDPLNRTPVVRLDFTWDSIPVSAFSSHPLPPSNPEQFASQTSYLTWLTREMNDCGRALILAGDLNATESDPRFTRILEDARLRDSRNGFGWQPSWPTQLPWMRIPLDHVLLSEPWIVLDRHLGPDIGSDHLPVLVTAAIRR
jgi:endonuclease/exonuclease/phosphatase (EEP) superfamily protein YafD